MNKKWDVLGIGISTVDELLYLDHYPAADTKMALQNIKRQGGGLVATALVAAARLGVRAAYGGILGLDDASQWIETDLAREGVDISPVIHRDDTFASQAFIMVDSTHHTRTILFRVDEQPFTLDDMPTVETVRQAHILLIDDVITTHVVQLAQIARESGIDVVADLEFEPSLLMNPSINHLIVSSGFAVKHSDATNPMEAAKLFWHDQRAAVVVTDGANGAYFYTGEGDVQHQPAFEVDVVDTTGCGDVFHGAYTAALRWGYPVESCVRFASATSALKATQPGGRQGIPDQETVEAFLAEN